MAADGTPTAKRHGSPTFRAESCTSTETAPYAFVLGSAKKRSATSRCTITHQRCNDGACSRDSTTSGVATLYGRLATSLVGSGSSSSIASWSASPQTSRTFEYVAERGAQLRLERAIELDRVDEPCALCETTREDAETRADLEHDVRRARDR